ncbi:EF-hand domain [Macleaya cordata]|uniref:EF-hand domain n=1 Tax=Macleaya cordata TaxID=56857 RepID=A0A200QJ54_MACCD|nr:EF-hand domain [Macleaya cordata]
MASKYTNDDNSSHPHHDNDELDQLLKILDHDGDCKITEAELAAALRKHKVWFCGWKAWWTMQVADINKDKVVKGNKEMRKLLELVKNKYPALIKVSS